MTTNATLTTRVAKTKIRNRAFGGSTPDSMPVMVKITTGAPSFAAPCIGTFCYNAYDDQVYICTVISGTWVQISV